MAMFNSYVSHYQRVSYSATLETPPPSSSTAPVAHGGARFGASPWFWPRGNRVSLVVLLGVMMYDSYDWLVLLTILKNISQWEGLSHILWKIKNVWNHQPDDIWFMIFLWLMFRLERTKWKSFVESTEKYPFIIWGWSTVGSPASCQPLRWQR